MKERTKPSTTAVCLSIELVQSFERGQVTWWVLTSRAGRDGTFERSWSNVTSQLDEAQAQDLCAWVQHSAYAALVAWSGIQGTLEP
jgi:hypothetical protein